MMLPEEVFRRGKEEVRTEPIKLRAGPLSMLFEPDSAFLRYVQLGDREIVRGIYVAVRDHNWSTVPSKVSDLKLEATADAFELTFEVKCREGEIDFLWTGTTTGDPRGNVTFVMDGIARSTFLRNRIGFCILHPMRECAGEPCTVEKVDGIVEHGTFPRQISPYQPFKDMRAISYQVSSDLSAEVRFEGDVFEMEDQRNWTDASFKTYCTPLDLPFPVEVEEGTRVVQSVTIRPEAGLSAQTTEFGAGAPEIVFDVEESLSTTLPQVGLGVASHGRSLSKREQERLKALNLCHLRVDLDLTESGYEDVLGQAAVQARELEVKLEIALFLSETIEDELAEFAKHLEEFGPPVSRWLLFDAEEKVTSQRGLRLAREPLLGYDAEVKVGVGTNAYFTELNREHPPVEGADLVCYSISPQVHAFDDTSLVEALEAQGEIVQSARHIAGDLPILITPITLKPRFNPNATGLEPGPAPDELPDQVDSRQTSLLGAGWTLGSLKHLSESGVYSTTYYETTGWRGVMETESGSRLPDKFLSIPGATFPLYHALADVGEFAGGEVRHSTSSAPSKVEGMALRKGDRSRLLLANLSPEPQHVRVECLDLGDYVRVKHLNEKNAEEAMCSPESYRAEPGLLQQTAGNRLRVCLLPFALVRIDSVGETYE